MNVVFIGPGYPDEMPLFVRGLAMHGARIYGVGDVHEGQLPALTRQHLTGYLRVANFTDQMAVVGAVIKWMRGKTIDRICCYWEPRVMLAARMREALGVPGMEIEQALRFRDKDVMKQIIDAAGIRAPRHAKAISVKEAYDACEHVGFPAVVKSAAGSDPAEAFRVENSRELETALSRLARVPELAIEEFIDGEEHTYDVICASGEIKYRSIGCYRPNQIVARTNEWISPQTHCLRQSEDDAYASGHALGRSVLDAMGFQTGFVHINWFRTPDGGAVFSDVAARPASGRMVDLMNYVSDTDLFVGCAEAELKGTFSQPSERKYTAINIYKRAHGAGHIYGIEGLSGLLHRYSDHIVVLDLLPIGSPRRDWRLSTLSDGHVTIRHPEYGTACEIADAFGSDLKLYAS